GPPRGDELMQARSLAVSPGWRLVAAFNVLVLIFLVTPVIIVVLQAFNSGSFLTFPPEGFSTRWFVNFFTSRPFMDAFQVSLLLAVYTVLISTVVGTASALVLVRQRFWGRDFLNLLFMSPLMLPALLTGHDRGTGLRCGQQDRPPVREVRRQDL